MMKIIEYFSTDNKEYWLSKIKESDWGAGQFLYDLLKNQKLKPYVGENTKVLLLVDGENLISFCTFADKDDIQPTELTPWIGWVYTFPNYRGNRYIGKLLSYAEILAEEAGMKNIYISTNHNGLYEKYGYEFYEMMKDMNGEDSRVYVKHVLLSVIRYYRCNIEKMLETINIPVIKITTEMLRKYLVEYQTIIVER